MKQGTKIQKRHIKTIKKASFADRLKRLSEQGKGRNILIKLMKKNTKRPQTNWSDWDQGGWDKDSWDRD